MIDKSISTQSNSASSTSSWSSYFTWAAKAMALLSGVGGIGMGIMRYLQQDNAESTLAAASEPLSLLPKGEENTASLLVADSNEITQSIPDTSLVVSVLETMPQIEKNNIEEATQHSEITEIPTHFSKHHLRSESTVLNAIPDQVINANEIYNYQINAQKIFGNNTQAFFITGDFPNWMNTNYYSQLGSYTVAGTANQLSVVGNIAYLAAGSGGLQIFNISDPAHPVLLGSYVTSSAASRIAVTGKLACVAMGTSSLQIFNVSNPRNPFLASTYTLPYTISDIVMNNTTVYVVDGLLLNLLDLSNATNPVLVGSGYLPATGNTLALSNKIASVAMPNGFSNYQVVPPTGALNLGSVTFLGNTGRGSLSVVGNIAYVAVRGASPGLKIFNIANPASPTLLSYYPTVNAYGIDVVGTIAYVADWNGGLKIFNVANPASPTLLSNNPTTYGMVCITVSGNMAYIGQTYFASGFLLIYNVANPASPTLLATQPLPGFPASITIIGSAAYVTMNLGWYGLQVFSISNPSSILLVNIYPTTGGIGGFTEVNNIVYLGTDNSGLILLDFSTNVYFGFLSTYSTVGFAQGIAVVGTLAYVAQSDFGLQIIDVANPRNPVLLVNFNYPGEGYSNTVVIGTKAYLIGNNNAGGVLRILNIASLPFVSNYATLTNPLGIVTASNVAYVAEGSAGLQILNITNPSSFKLLSSYKTTGSVQAVKLNDKTAFLLSNAGLQMLNVANSTNPISIGTCGASGFANDIAITGNTMIVASNTYGLQFFNLAQGQLHGIPGIEDIGNHYSFTVTGRDNAGNFVSDTFQVTVAQFPTVFQPITPPQAFWTQKPFSITIPLSTFINSDINSNPLSYSATLSDNSFLPIWINFNASSLIFSGQTPLVAASTTWVVRLKATNTLGGYTSTTFPLTVNPNLPPIVMGSIPFQFPKVDQPFNYFIPQGMFSDPEGDVLLFSARLSNSTTLPNWLNFNPISATFSGLPHIENTGNFTVIVSATDNIAGSVSTQFGMYITYLPQLNGNVPQQVAGINVPYQYAINKNIFISLGGNNLIYEVRRKGGLALPQWLQFNASNLVLSGTANSTYAGTTTLQLTASDAYQGSVSTLFDLIVENFPYVNQLISNQIAGINQAFYFALPTNTFRDADGDIFTYQAALSDGSGLPNWLNWNAFVQQFTGTPLVSDRGIKNIRVSAIDSFGGMASTTFNLTVENFPVAQNVIPDQLAGVNLLFSYILPVNAFTDADGEPLAYQLKLIGNAALPNWLNWNAVARQLEGTPRSNNTGLLNLQVIATDPFGGSASSNFNLRVENFPYVNQLIPNQVVGINLPLTYTVPAITFIDVDGDTLTYQAALASGLNLPNWLNWNSLVRQFTGTPSNSDKGIQTIRITAIDSFGGFNSTIFNLTIENFPIVTNPIPAQVAGVNVTYSYAIPANTFSDTDGESLRLMLGNVLPTWLSWNASTTQLRGMPRASDVGIMNVQIIATDPLGGSITNTFSLRVENFPYVNQFIPNQVAGINQAFYFVLPTNTFRDADGDALTYQAVLSNGNVLPNWLNWNALAQQLTGTPLISDRGIKNILITATDLFGGFASTIFNLTVENFPTLQIPIPNQLAGVNVPFSYTIPSNTFIDIDGEPLTYQIQNLLPDWLSWNAIFRQLQGTPRSNNTGLLGLQVTATDPLGGSATTTFILKVENFPRVAHNIPNQLIGINQVFDYDIPDDTFVDDDGDTLTYQATLTSGSSLPNWLNWNALTQQLSGTPLLSDRGTKNIRITASDPFGGFAQAFFNITVTNLPVLANAIPDQLTDVDVFFAYTVPSQTFVAPDGDMLTYTAQLTSGDVLPNWLNWQALIRQLSGTPYANNTGVLDIKIIATNTLDYSVSDTFLLRVDNFPRVNRVIPNKIAGINLPLSYTLPTDTFIDEDGDTLSYQSTLASGVGLPNWLSFNPTALQFTGTPLASDRGVNILRVIATDPFGGLASTTFNLTVENLPVLVRPIGNLLAGVNKNFSYILPLDTFSDADEATLIYSVNLLSGNNLPAWLNWTVAARQLQGIPHASDIGIMNLKMIASDALGASVSDNFNIRVEYFPQLNRVISNQVAGVNQVFSFTLPADTFVDLDGDLLSYTAKLTSENSLPNWLQWDGETRKFKGTPQNSDIGTNTLQVIATDPLGATASGNFQLSVIQLPILNHLITPPASFREGKIFIFTLPDDTFSEPNHLPLHYTATLSNGASLPSWLMFNSSTLTFTGLPTVQDEGTFVIEVTATNTQDASTTGSFTFKIISNSAPIVVNSISNQVAKVGSFFKYVVPTTTFSDADGDTLTYSAQLSDGAPLPGWLKFESNTFSGTPGGGDTNFYQTRILAVALKATDGSLSISTVFNLSVDGVSTGERAINIVTPIISGLGTAYTFYKKRHFLMNNLCKKRYQKLEDTAIVGEAYSRQLETPAAKVATVQAKFPRSPRETCIRFFKCQTNALPGGALLPEWLAYDEATNTLHSKGDGPKEANIGTLIIQVKDTGGVIQEQFTLKITSAEQALSEVVTTRAVDSDDDYDRAHILWNDVPLQPLRDDARNKETEQAAGEMVNDEELMQLAPRR